MAHLVAKMKSFDFTDRMFKTPENVQKFTFAECREKAVNKRYRGYLATWSEKDIKAVLRQGFLWAYGLHISARGVEQECTTHGEGGKEEKHALEAKG